MPTVEISDYKKGGILRLALVSLLYISAHPGYHEPVSGFPMSLSRPIVPLGVHQTIIYDHMVTDIGNADNQYTGVYKAKMTGYYVFSVSVKPYSESSVDMELMRNGRVKTWAPSHVEKHDIIYQNDTRRSRAIALT